MPSLLRSLAQDEFVMPEGKGATAFVLTRFRARALRSIPAPSCSIVRLQYAIIGVAVIHLLFACHFAVD